MLYIVYEEDENNKKKTLAILHKKSIAEEYVKELNKEKDYNQKRFYLVSRALTYYGYDIVLEDDDIDEEIRCLKQGRV